MGTETILCVNSSLPVIFFTVKLNNPQMGTETLYIYRYHNF